jgi:ribosome-associated translation inhibitor RaiA
MRVPLEITYRDVVKTTELDNLINMKTEKLEKICDSVISCRVTVEKQQSRQNSGNPYRVCIELAVPQGHKIVVSQVANEEDRPMPIPKIVRRAFEVAYRRLKEVIDKQRGNVKSRTGQEADTFVT